MPTGGKDAMGAQMNHSIHSADRSTHLKIVVMALVAGIVVAGLGISARTNADYSQTANVVKAGQPVADDHRDEERPRGGGAGERAAERRTLVGRFDDHRALALQDGRDERIVLGREVHGAHGERVSDPKELRPALERCQASGRCAVIHVDVNPVKHMWAPGLIHFKDMHQEPKGR